MDRRLPITLVNAIAGYLHGNFQALEEHADDLANGVRNPAYAWALMPPAYYEYAWRAMFDVPREALAEILGADPATTGCASGLGYSPPTGRRLQSWTVDPDLYRMERGDHGEYKGFVVGPATLGTWTLVVRAPRGDNLFALNPETIYDEVDEFDFACEQEVVSIGRVADVTLCYAQARAGETRRTVTRRALRALRAVGRNRE